MDESITLEDVLLWIHRNSEDVDAMSKISVTAYPYSRKYRDRYPERDLDTNRED